MYPLCMNPIEINDTHLHKKEVFELKIFVAFYAGIIVLFATFFFVYNYFNFKTPNKVLGVSTTRSISEFVNIVGYNENLKIGSVTNETISTLPGSVCNTSVYLPGSSSIYFATNISASNTSLGIMVPSNAPVGNWMLNINCSYSNSNAQISKPVNIY